MTVPDVTIDLSLEQVNTSEAAGTVEVCVSVLNGVLEREVVLTVRSENGESRSLKGVGCLWKGEEGVLGRGKGLAVHVHS